MRAYQTSPWHDGRLFFSSSPLKTRIVPTRPDRVYHPVNLCWLVRIAKQTKVCFPAWVVWGRHRSARTSERHFSSRRSSSSCIWQVRVWARAHWERGPIKPSAGSIMKSVLRVGKIQPSKACWVKLSGLPNANDGGMCSFRLSRWGRIATVIAIRNNNATSISGKNVDIANKFENVPWSLHLNVLSNQSDGYRDTVISFLSSLILQEIIATRRDQVKPQSSTWNRSHPSASLLRRRKRKSTSLVFWSE